MANTSITKMKTAPDSGAVSVSSSSSAPNEKMSTVAAPFPILGSGENLMHLMFTVGPLVAMVMLLIESYLCSLGEDNAEAMLLRRFI